MFTRQLKSYVGLDLAKDATIDPTKIDTLSILLQSIFDINFRVLHGRQVDKDLECFEGLLTYGKQS